MTVIIEQDSETPRSQSSQSILDKPTKSHWDPSFSALTDNKDNQTSPTIESPFDAGQSSPDIPDNNDATGVVTGIDNQKDTPTSAEYDSLLKRIRPENVYNWDEVIDLNSAIPDSTRVVSSLTKDMLSFKEGLDRGESSQSVFDNSAFSKATGLTYQAINENSEQYNSNELIRVMRSASNGDSEPLKQFLDSKPNLSSFLLYNSNGAKTLNTLAKDKVLFNLESLNKSFIEDSLEAMENGNAGVQLNSLYLQDFWNYLPAKGEERIKHLKTKINAYSQGRLGEGTLDYVNKTISGYIPQLANDTSLVLERGMESGAMYRLAGALVGSAIEPGGGTLVGSGAGWGIGFGIGAKVGYAEASYKNSLAQMWGAIRDLKDDEGNTIDPTTARTISAIAAAPMAVIDSVVFSKVIKTIPSLGKFFETSAVSATIAFLKKNPKLTNTLGSPIINAVEALGTATLGNAVEEYIAVKAENVARGIVGNDKITGEEQKERIIEAAKEGATVALPFVALGTSARFYHDIKQAKAEKSKELLDKLNQAITESEAVKESPEIAKDYVKHLSDTGSIPDIYVRPWAIQRVFFQSEQGKAIAQKMGITPEILYESLTLDTDIMIPADKALTHILGNEEVYNSLSKDMRVSPDVMTPHELSTLNKSDHTSEEINHHAKDVDAFVENVFNNVEEDVRRTIEREEIARPYVEQLTNLGYSEENAQHLMSPFMAHAEVFAPMFNQTPKEYIDSRFAGFKSTVEKGAQRNSAGVFLQSGKKKSKAKGSIDFSNPQAVITLFKGKSNLSTVIHEGGHFFLENLREAATLENAPEWVREIWSTLEKEYGIKDNKLSEAHHERFAKEFEIYARTGKAPSHHLQGAFRKFNTWLTKIYTSVKNLIGKEELSKDISNVFDRLLATEKEIEEAKSQGSPVGLHDLEANGLEVNPRLKERYADAINESAQKTASIIEIRRLVEQREIEKNVKQEAQENIKNNPFYQSEDAVREKGGIDIDLLSDHLDAEFVERLKNKWNTPFSKGLLKKNGKVNIEDALLMFNVESVAELANKLSETDTRREFIKKEVSKSLREWESSFDGKVEYSSAMDRALVVELEALTGEKQVAEETLRNSINKNNNKKNKATLNAEYNALKESLYKQELLLKETLQQAKKDVREAQNSGVIAGEMHEGAKRAKERTKWQERIAKIKERERALRMALSANYLARIETGKITNDIKRKAKSKTINDAFKQQILAIIEHWQGLGTPSMKPRDTLSLPRLSEFVQQFESFFDDQKGLFPEWILAEDMHKSQDNIRNLSIEELRDIKKTIDILAHHGRAQEKLISFGKEVKTTEITGQMIDSLNKLKGTKYLSEKDRNTFIGKLRGLIRGLSSNITAMRYVFGEADGFTNKGGKNSTRGVHEQVIIGGLEDAVRRSLELKRKYSDKLVKIFQSLKSKDMRKSFTIEGVKLPEDVAKEWSNQFTRERVIAVALNMGNEGNIKALKHGYGWSDADLQRILSHLTREDLNAIQKIWDTIEELYPVLNETHLKMNGVPLSKVKASPITILAKDGEVSLRGGYYPLDFDKKFSKSAEKFDNIDSIMNMNEGFLGRPTPKSGMTKERKGGMLPPLLKLSVLSEHISDTIHYATHAPILQDIYKIVRKPEYERAFKRALGNDLYGQLIPWLRSIAVPDTSRLGWFQNAAEKVATSGTRFTMAMNMKSALLQLTSIGNSFTEIGVKNFFNGAYRLVTTRGLKDEIREKSVYMASREKFIDASLKEWTDKFNPYGQGDFTVMGVTLNRRKIADTQFFFIQAFDACLSMPTWIGAYDNAISKGISEHQAISRADEAVMRAQGNGGSIDAPTMLRERGFIKLSTTFTTFAINEFNRKKYYTKGLIEKARGGNSNIGARDFTKMVVYELVLSSVLGAFLSEYGKNGTVPDGTDILKEGVLTNTMWMPLGRDAISIYMEKMTGGHSYKSLGDSVGLLPLKFGLDTATNVSEYFSQGKSANLEDAFIALIHLAGFKFGLSTLQIIRSIKGTESFLNGEGGISNIFLGPPEKQKKKNKY